MCVVDRGLSFFFLQTDVEIQCMTELLDLKEKRALVHSSFFKQKWQFKINIPRLSRRPPANSIKSRPERMHYLCAKSFIIIIMLIFHMILCIIKNASQTLSVQTILIPLILAKAWGHRLCLTLGLHFTNLQHMLLIDYILHKDQNHDNKRQLLKCQAARLQSA